MFFLCWLFVFFVLFSVGVVFCPLSLRPACSTLSWAVFCGFCLALCSLWLGSFVACASCSSLALSGVLSVLRLLGVFPRLVGVALLRRPLRRCSALGRSSGPSVLALFAVALAWCCSSGCSFLPRLFVRVTLTVGGCNNDTSLSSHQR